MKKGRIVGVPPRFVVPVVDVDLFDDGHKWTLWVLDEDLTFKNGFRYLKNDARVVSVACQDPPAGSSECRISKKTLRILQRRYGQLKGATE